VNATAGAANTGGGGGGGSDDRFVGGTGMAGGSGVVIIRQSYGAFIANTTGGTSLSSDGEYIIYTFTSSGTISWAA
jgi:hypothetical protein